MKIVELRQEMPEPVFGSAFGKHQTFFIRSLSSINYEGGRVPHLYSLLPAIVILQQRAW